MNENSLKVLVFTVFFISGSLNVALSNILYNVKAVGLHNRLLPFHKPYFQTWANFVAMSFALLVCTRGNRCPCHRSDPNAEMGGFTWFRRASLPGICDLVQALLSNIALLYLDPSLWQILRGSLLIFTALIGILYRHRRVSCTDWLGISITVVGMIVVGVSAMFESRTMVTRSSGGQLALGMGVVIISQAFGGMTAVLEEELIDDYPDTHPLELIGAEGLWGLWVATIFVLPIANVLPEDAGEGIFESSVESFTMLASSLKLIGLLVFYIVAVSAYNQSNMILISITSAIHSTIYEALRSIPVWIVSVAIDYIWPETGAGEKLNWMSLARAAGFGIMLAGTMVYNRVIKMPGVKDGEGEEEEKKKKEGEKEIELEAVEQGSPAMTSLKDLLD
jgi:drug/metabolite transporter (DMT)-like permease